MSLAQQTTGLILAGGAGRRVGGRDKGLLPWHGRPLVELVAERLRPQVGSLLISCNRNTEYYATLADATVADSRRDFQGPLAGLEAAAPHIDSDYLVVAPCDAPSLPTDLADRLMAALRGSVAGNGADICYAHDGERGQYLCAAMRATVLCSLGTFLDSGQRAVHSWYELHQSIPVDFSDRGECFRNINRLD